MNRREFLKRTSLAAANTGFALSALDSYAAPTHLVTESQMPDARVNRFVDAHIHLYDTTRPGGVPFPNPEETLIYRPMLPRDIRSAAEPVGIRGAVFVECSPIVEDNQWVLDLVADEPFICAVVGNLDPEREGFPALLERFASNPHFRGIRIRTGRRMNFDHPQLRPNLGALAATGLTLDVNLQGQEILRMAQLAREVPSLRIMVDHMAFVPVTGKAPDPVWIEQMKSFKNLPNVFCKVSRYTEQAVIQPGPLDTAYYAPTFEALWQIFGQDRLAYGSNWPPCLQAGEYSRTVVLAHDFFQTKGPGPLAKVMGANTAAFYGGPRFDALTQSSHEST